MRTDRPVFFQHMRTLGNSKTDDKQYEEHYSALITADVCGCVCVCLYRGDAVGQVVLAGDTQQFILR